MDEDEECLLEDLSLELGDDDEDLGLDSFPEGEGNLLGALMVSFKDEELLGVTTLEGSFPLGTSSIEDSEPGFCNRLITESSFPLPPFPSKSFFLLEDNPSPVETRDEDKCFRFFEDIDFFSIRRLSSSERLLRMSSRLLSLSLEPPKGIISMPPEDFLDMDMEHVDEDTGVIETKGLISGTELSLRSVLPVLNSFELLGEALVNENSGLMCSILGGSNMDSCPEGSDLPVPGSVFSFRLTVDDDPEVEDETLCLGIALVVVVDGVDDDDDDDFGWTELEASGLNVAS